MSGKVRQRGATNLADSATLSVNERILKECHSLYTDSDNGMDCLTPHRLNFQLCLLTSQIYLPGGVICSLC